MNISGIRPNAGFYDYNSIKSDEIKSQQILENKQEDKPPAVSSGEKSSGDRDFDAYD